MLYRKDPVTRILEQKLAEIAEKNYSKEEFQRLFSDAMSERDGLLCLAYALTMLDSFPENVRACLNLFDAFITLGYYFDAEKLIENHFYKRRNLYYHEPHPLIMERYYDLLIMQREYRKALEIVFRSLAVLRENGRLQDKVKKDVARIKLVDFYGSAVDGANYKHAEFSEAQKYSMEDLYLAYKDKNADLLIEVTWRLYEKGEYDESFFLLATELFPGETTSSFRYNFFITESYRLYSSNPVFLIRYCTAQAALGFFEKVYFILKGLDLKGILRNPNVCKHIRETIYNLYLKMTAWVGYDEFTLIDYKDACCFDLVRPYALDLVNKGSRFIHVHNEIEASFVLEAEKTPYSKLIKEVWNEVKFINSEKSSFRVKKKSLVLAGQIRGINGAKKYIQKMMSDIPFNYISISTWNAQSIKSPRLERLQRYFPSDIYNLIPGSHQSVDKFSEAFPLLSNQLKNLSKLPVSYDDFDGINFNHLQIDSEEQFEAGLLERRGNFSVRGLFNQAKMFYKMSDLNGVDVENDDALVRSRMDISPNFKVDINHYLEVIGDGNDNYIYVNYFGPACSMGDQFWVCGGRALKKMSKIWSFSLANNSLTYAGFFDDYAHLHAAEDLCIAQAIAYAVDVRYLPSVDAVNFVSPNVFDYVDISNNLDHDFNSLSDRLKNAFGEFYASLNKYKN